MMRYLSIFLALAVTACAQVGFHPTDKILSNLRGGARGDLFIAGISIDTLYDGYWTPAETVTHDPGGNNISAVELDPLQTSYGWMEDTVSNAEIWGTQLGLLRTEWSTDGNKFSETVDRTFYVNADLGTDSGAGTSRGASAWATLLYAVNQVGTGDGTATKIVLESGIHYLEANAADAGTGDPVGGAATVKIQNYAGTASDPLMVVWESGASVRIGHTWLAANYATIKAGTDDLNIGIQVTGTSAYVEFWDPVGIGPMFEIPYTDGGGDASFIATISHTGDNISIIGGEVTQWPHCGYKGDLKVYGAYVHNNGAASGASAAGHDHGIYLTDGATDSIVEGCVIIANYTNGLNPRNYDVENLVIRGNIIGYNGGYGINCGGFATIVENNVFVSNSIGGVLWGDDSAGLLLRNNAIYETNIDTIGLGGNYTRPIGFTWTTNGRLTGETTSAVPSYTAWTSSTTVPRPASLYYGANNYYNRTTASTTTGATAPVHVSGDASDDNVTWSFVNSGAGAETFGSFTTIDAADFNAFGESPATRDFRPAAGSDLLTNGTNYGYGTTIGAFAAAP